MIDRCDNHYTTNTSCAYGWLKKDTIKFNFNYASLYAKAQKQKNTYFFSIFCNIPNVICSHLPFVSIYYNVTLFIFEYVHKIISDPPLVISPPLCSGFYEFPILSTSNFHKKFDQFCKMVIFGPPPSLFENTMGSNQFFKRSCIPIFIDAISFF